MWNGIKTIVLALAALITIPLSLLAWIAPITCIVWLLFLGLWQLIIIGIVLGLVAGAVVHWVLSLVSRTSMLSISKNQKIMPVALSIYVVVAFSIMTAFAFFVFNFAINAHHSYGRGSILPFMLWAYGTSATPWSGSREENSGPGIMWFSASQYGSVTMLVTILVHGTLGSGYAYIIGGLLGLLTGWIVTKERTPPPKAQPA